MMFLLVRLVREGLMVLVALQRRQCQVPGSPWPLGKYGETPSRQST
jgi:hypothetical protein